MCNKQGLHIEPLVSGTPSVELKNFQHCPILSMLRISLVFKTIVQYYSVAGSSFFFLLFHLSISGSLSVIQARLLEHNDNAR
jgi:hypothetical protein